MDLLIFALNESYIYVEMGDLWHFCFEFILLSPESPYIMPNISLVLNSMGPVGKIE